MKPVLLIGGTGLMGPAVVRELEAVGKEVVCINRSGLHPTGGDALVADRNSFDQLRGVFRKFEYVDLTDMIPYTARQASLLVEALEGKQPAATVVSSIDVYQAYNNLHSRGETPMRLQSVPLREDAELRSRISFQGLEYDKLNVERIYWSYFDACSVLRMPAIYGLPDISRVQKYGKALLNQQKITMNTDLANWTFSRSFNLNCAHAIVLATGLEKREVFNVSELQHYSELEWCELLANALNVEGDISFDKDAPVPYNMNTKQHWTVDSTKIRDQLGYTEKYSTEAGVKQVLQELRMINEQH